MYARRMITEERKGIILALEDPVGLYDGDGDREEGTANTKAKRLRMHERSLLLLSTR